MIKSINAVHRDLGKLHTNLISQIFAQELLSGNQIDMQQAIRDA